MKSFIFVALGFGLSLTSQAETSVKFIEMKSFKELESLPPKLTATFGIACNQKLLQVIRHELMDESTQKITIFIGALVQDTQPSLCQEPAKDISVFAGTTYSGREYDIVSIGSRYEP